MTTSRNPGEKGYLKDAVYAAMPAAYAAASDNDTLPAPARQVAYALRRIAGLGDDLSADYVLKGARGGLINAYQEDHPIQTAGWDIVRDARGNFLEPHRSTPTPLSTLKVREYLEWDGLDPGLDDEVPTLGLGWPTWGPRDRYGAILYIEKEGFAEQIAAAEVQERFDLAVMSSKGYSVRAARRMAVELAERNDVPVLVAHDFDKQGIGIFDLIREEVEEVGGECIDLGLRLADVGQLQPEPVSYGKSDPLKNLSERGADTAEIAFLRQGKQSNGSWYGQRVELNALVGREFIDWLEEALENAGVEKIIPEPATLEAAFRRAYRNALVNRVIREAAEEATDRAAEVDTPDDLLSRVRTELERAPERRWDGVVGRAASDAVEDGE